MNKHCVDPYALYAVLNRNISCFVINAGLFLVLKVHVHTRISSNKCLLHMTGYVISVELVVSIQGLSLTVINRVTSIYACNVSVIFPSSMPWCLPK